MRAELSSRALSFMWDDYRGWIRLGRRGWGIATTNHNQSPPLFSERYGYTRCVHLGARCFRILRPEGAPPGAQP